MEGWIAVTRTTTLGQKPRRVSLLNKNYVVWRDKNHLPRIQNDTCRHRGASLSTGKVKDGCIECPYHGWKYTENSVIQPWSKVPEYFTNEFSTKDKDGISTKLFGIQTTMNFHKFVLPYTTWSDVTISGGKILTTYVTLCPLNHSETKMFVGFSQNFGIPSEVFILMGKAIVEQDRAILENINPSYRFKGIPGEHDDLVEMYRRSLQRLVFR